VAAAAGVPQRLKPVPLCSLCAARLEVVPFPIISPTAAVVTLRVFRRFPGEQSPAEAGGDGVVYLDEDYRGDAVVGVEEAEGGAGGVEGLGDYDAADYGGVDFLREVVGEQFVAGGVGPAPEESESEEENVAPIDQERGAVVDELG